MPPETIGLAIIARNEEKNLPVLLNSISGAFDQVVLVDTGSTDRTVEVFAEWAQKEQLKWDLNWGFAHFKWCDDFAAARTFADEQIETDWVAWADCDDLIINADRLHRVVANVPEHIAGLVFGYDYAQDPNTGNCVCFLKRERLVRRGAGTWVGRVHEAQTVNGQTMYVPPDVVVWKHMKQVAVQSFEEANERALASNDRNLTILEKWNSDEPSNPRVLGYLGTELAAKGRHEDALPYYAEYLSVSDGGWKDEYAQIMRKYSASLLALGRVDEAKSLGGRAVTFHPQWPDGAITLAECALVVEDYEGALLWIRSPSIEIPRETMLIINPLDYTFLPLRIKAIALAGLGRIDEALETAAKALEVFPDGDLAQKAQTWEASRKRDNTARAFVEAARVLVNHDEQWKGRTLLEQCVPHYCNDHPLVVAARTELRGRTLWATDPDAYAKHYREGGSKPEDFLDDETSDRVAMALPRAGFLIDGILDQAGIEQ